MQNTKLGRPHTCSVFI